MSNMFKIYSYNINYIYSFLKFDECILNYGDNKSKKNLFIHFKSII